MFQLLRSVFQALVCVRGFLWGSGVEDKHILRHHKGFLWEIMKLHFVSAECRRWAEDSGHSLPGQADAVVASFGELLRAHSTAVGMTVGVILLRAQVEQHFQGSLFIYGSAPPGGLWVGSWFSSQKLLLGGWDTRWGPQD